MLIDKLVNVMLAVFNIGAADRRVWFHSQNLNEDRFGKTGLPWSGRCWLHVGRHEFRCEWSFGRLSSAVEIDIDDESCGLRFHLAVPLVSLWLCLPLSRRLVGYGHGLVLFSLRFFERALWWQFGGNHMEWNSKTPRWKHGCFHFDDFLLGRQKFTEKILSTQDVLVPMPEGSYRATLKLEECEWKRPRWPWPIIRRTASIDVPKGIPHAGKGENDYDCGEDATFGLSCEAWTVDEAVSKLVASVLKSRRKYDGNAMVVYPPPSVRQAEARA